MSVLGITATYDHYLANPDLAPYIQKVVEGPFSKAEIINRVANELIKEAQSIGYSVREDADLVDIVTSLNKRAEDIKNVFSVIAKQLLGGEQTLFHLEEQAKDPIDLARLICKWMHENQDILASVTSLDLTGLGLTHLFKEIGLLYNLEILILNQNFLKDVPEEMGELRELLTLHLCSNQLEVLDEWIGKLTQLQILDVGHNCLKKISPEIKGLRKIQGISLTGNALDSLPKEIGFLSTLLALVIQDNQLTKLPATLGILWNLEILLLNNNQISELPHLGNLKKLTQLDVDGNKLEELPRWLPALESLETLEMAYNRLTVLPPAPFMQELTKLKEADFSHNQLRKKPEEEIAGMGSCKFDFSGNPFPKE